MKYPSIKIEVHGPRGSSSISLERLPYRRVLEKIDDYLDYVFRGEEGPIRLRMEGSDGREAISRELEDMEPEEAPREVGAFLGYLYGVDPSIGDAVLQDVQGHQLPSWLNQDPHGLTQKEKVFLLLKHGHPDSWVRSQDIQKEYEIVYGEDIQLSSVSTYLSRYYNDGQLQRRGNRAQWEY
ncbi:MAG: hypothetical protein GXO65_01925, partial [Euryarchaeota archaeon]|nr:hypothetical protein [Euryarchaeota archaeon]